MGIYLLDQYSYLHFASGIIAYFWGLSFRWWVVLHIAFEIVENLPQTVHFIDTYLKVWPGGKRVPDSFSNIVGDNVAAFLGWYSAYKLDQLGSKLGWYELHIKA